MLMADALGPFTTLHSQTTSTRLVTINSTRCPRKGGRDGGSEWERWVEEERVREGEKEEEREGERGRG